MKAKKENPAAGGSASGAHQSEVDQELKYTSARGEWKLNSYYLHVREDGSEKRYRKEPTDSPTLTVEIVEDRGRSILERTWTLKILVDDERIVVRPRGLGWVAEDETDEWSSWLRVRVS
jgi:hypothetical protein